MSTQFRFMSDEELLKHVYMHKHVCTPLETELADRLKDSLDRLLEQKKHNDNDTRRPRKSSR